MRNRRFELMFLAVLVIAVAFTLMALIGPILCMMGWS